MLINYKFFRYKINIKVWNAFYSMVCSRYKKLEKILSIDTKPETFAQIVLTLIKHIFTQWATENEFCGDTVHCVPR